MERLRLKQEAASSSPAVPAMPKSPENALEFPQDTAVAQALTRHRGPNQMKAITPSKSIKKKMAVRDRHHDLVPRSILDGGSRP